MTVYNPQQTEREVMEFWKRKKIPEKIVRFDKKKKKFYLLDGPPYVNYIPHVGHVKTTAFKDIWSKFKYMQGFAVWFQPGFDCSGLPIENTVEKKLGVKSKKDIIDKIGIGNFIKECKNLAEKNKPLWLNLYKKIAAWRGWLEPYMTYKNYYLESGWWTVKKLFEKGLLVEGFRPGFWCPRCETVLSGYEVSDSYKNLEDISIFIKFRVKTKKNEFLLVWTTTPWTLPGNVAIAVHPDEKYVRVQIGTGEILILAKKRLQTLTDLDIGYRIFEEFPGKKLNGLKYEPLLDVPIQKELSKGDNAHRVLLSIPIMKKRVVSKVKVKKATEAKEEFGHIVDMETGSGLVHIAPGHGDVDNQLGKHYKIPEVSPVDEHGNLTKEAGEFSGMFVKDADNFIIEKLKKNNLLLHSEKITHSYPLCWRCKSPLIYRMSKQWFLKVDKNREKMIKENKKVRWLPEFAGERFHSVLIDAPDWAITRQRFWGIPLPIWTCEKCKKKRVIGSRKELIKESIKKLTDDVDLHKDVVDNIKIKCKCGSEMSRVSDIMDVWFDSGISPWASLGYPFQNKALFEKLWPVDLIDESQDQTRGWFYTLMFCSVATFNKSPYKTVCLNGWTLDEKGEKMSKSLGNVILADDAQKQLGADLLRLYYCWDVAPWDTQKFSMRVVEEELRRVLNILWNTYLFVKAYSDKKAMNKKMKDFALEDKWILSRVNTLINNVTDDFENFRFHQAGRNLVDFILNDFSRWYIKIIRDRTSPFYTGKDKESAQYTLFYVLEKLVKLLAPITPFITEKIYTDVFNEKESVHFCSWPKVNKDYIDKKLEREMETIKMVSETMNFARQEQGKRLRWPLSDLFISIDNKKVASSVKHLEKMLKTICNVKDIKIVKKHTGPVKQFEGGKLSLGKVMPDYALVREMIRKIQVLRKENNFDVRDGIYLWLKSDKDTEELLEKYKKEIMFGVGARSLVFDQAGKVKGSLSFGGKTINIYFDKAK